MSLISLPKKELGLSTSGAQSICPLGFFLFLLLFVPG